MKLLVFAFLFMGSSALACDGEAKVGSIETASKIEDVMIAAVMTDPRSCNFTSDCLPNESCVRGECRLNGGGGCVTDVDCAVGERCIAGVCRR